MLIACIMAGPARVRAASWRARARPGRCGGWGADGERVRALQRVGCGVE